MWRRQPIQTRTRRRRHSQTPTSLFWRLDHVFRLSEYWKFPANRNPMCGGALTCV